MHIITGDCFKIIPSLKNNSIDLVCTSPPYANKRTQQYEAPTEEEYPNFTLKYFELLYPKLKETGSIAIVIRTNHKNGANSPYVLKTRLHLYENNWHEVLECPWIKTCSAPLGSLKRPRPSWEHILIYSKHPKLVYCNPTANGQWTERKYRESKKGVGEWVNHLGKKDARTGQARSPDYFSCAATKVDRNNDHPAQYPPDLAKWIIKMMCPPNGVALDPFCGVGSTGVGAKGIANFLGIEMNESWANYARKRLIF